MTILGNTYSQPFNVGDIKYYYGWKKVQVTEASDNEVNVKVKALEPIALKLNILGGYVTFPVGHEFYTSKTNLSSYCEKEKQK